MPNRIPMLLSSYHHRELIAASFMCKGDCVRCGTVLDESHQHARTPELMVTCGIFLCGVGGADVWDHLRMVVRIDVCYVLVLVDLILFESVARWA
jgi:hypothetical protein